MGKRGRGRPRSGRAAGGNPHGRPGKSAGPIGLTAVEGSPGVYELVHPRCVEEMEPDFQEGLELWKAGDPEEARDALRYTLQACPANLWVHVALGRIALEEFKDPILARGHFGYAVELRARSCQRVSRAAYRGIDRPTHRFTTPSKASSDAFAPVHAPRSREPDRVCPKTSRSLIAWVVVVLM